MTTISKEKIKEYRSQTYRLNRGSHLSSLQDALKFVEERGFIFFWPIKGAELPSLWTATAGDRPVANAHDDPGHVTWGWKDASLGMRVWYYGKVLRKRATMINLDIAPYFYALSKNYGDPVGDVHIQYYEGNLTKEAKAIFETILENGPMDTIAIRKSTHMISKESNSAYDRSISLLQSDFKILPVGISDSGGWRYAFIYDLVHRYHPEIPETAQHIKEIEARAKLMELYLLSVGACHFRDTQKLFQWRKEDTIQCLVKLVSDGIISRGLQGPDSTDEWFAHKDFLLT